MMQVRRRRQQFSPAGRPFIGKVNPDTFGAPGDACTVTGKRFGAMQGTSTLTLADNATYNQAVVKRDCTIVSWADAEIHATVPSFVGLPQTSYMFVVTSRGVSNAYPVSLNPVK